MMSSSNLVCHSTLTSFRTVKECKPSFSMCVKLLSSDFFKHVPEDGVSIKCVVI